MKIIKQNESELVTKDGNMFGSIFGLIFVGIGIFIFFSAGSKNALFAGIFAAFGLVIAFLNNVIIASFNKTSGEFIFQKKRLIGVKNVNYSIANIFRIETRENWKSENVNSGNNNRSFSRPVLYSSSVVVFKDGTEVIISKPQKKSSDLTIMNVPLSFNKGQSADVVAANQVANFLNVPFQEFIPPSGGMGINLGQGIKIGL